MLFAVPKKEWVGFSYSAKSLARAHSIQYENYLLNDEPLQSILKQANAQYWGPPTGRKGPYQALIQSSKPYWSYGVDIETGKPGKCQLATCVGVFNTPGYQYSSNWLATFYIEMYYYPVF